MPWAASPGGSPTMTSPRGWASAGWSVPSKTTKLVKNQASNRTIDPLRAPSSALAPIRSMNLPCMPSSPGLTTATGEQRVAATPACSIVPYEVVTFQHHPAVRLQRAIPLDSGRCAHLLVLCHGYLARCRRSRPPRRGPPVRRRRDLTGTFPGPSRNLHQRRRRKCVPFEVRPTARTVWRCARVRPVCALRRSDAGWRVIRSRLSAPEYCVTRRGRHGHDSKRALPALRGGVACFSPSFQEVSNGGPSRIDVHSR